MRLLRSSILRLLLLNIPLWLFVAWWMHVLDLKIFSHDDATRTMIAGSWARHPFLFTPDGQWLPLPFYLYGALWKLLGEPDIAFWFAPVSALMMAIGATGIGCTGIRLAGRGEHDTPVSLPILVFAAIVPVMLHDNWRVAPTALSEPPFLMLLGVSTALATGICIDRPVRPGRWILLAIVLFAWQMTRYEAIPIVFAMWTVAWLSGRSPALTRARSAAYLVGGYLFLILFPIAWIIYNLQLRGDALEFIDVTRDHAIRFTLFSEKSPAVRLGLVTEWLYEQAPLVMWLALTGVLMRRREPAVGPTAIGAIGGLTTNVSMALNNMIGTTAPTRFTLLTVWFCIPFAIVALTLWWRRGGWWRSALLITLGVVLAFGFAERNRRGWGGPLYPDYIYEELSSFGWMARKEGYTLVVEKQDHLGVMNELRMYAGADRIFFYDGFVGHPPVQGRFLLIRSSRGMEQPRRVNSIIGFDVLYLDQVPPDEPLPPHPYYPGFGDPPE